MLAERRDCYPKFPAGINEHREWYPMVGRLPDGRMAVECRIGYNAAPRGWERWLGAFREHLQLEHSMGYDENLRPIYERRFYGRALGMPLPLCGTNAGDDQYEPVMVMPGGPGTFWIGADPAAPVWWKPVLAGALAAAAVAGLQAWWRKLRRRPVPPRSDRVPPIGACRA